MQAVSKRLRFEYPINDATNDATSSGSSDDASCKNSDIRIAPVSDAPLEAEDELNVYNTMKLNKKNALVYHIISRCPEDEDERLETYRFYCNMYGIDPSVTTEDHQSYKAMKRCVSSLDFMVLCNLYQSRNMPKPDQYFAFYRESLALVFETANINSNLYVDNAILYTFTHSDCFKAVIDMHEFRVQQPDAKLPAEIETRYKEAVEHKCFRKYNRYNFSGLLNGNLRSVSRKSFKGKDFDVLIFQESKESFCEDETTRDEQEVDLSREIQISEGKSAVRYETDKHVELRHMANTNLKSGRKGKPIEASTKQGLQGLFFVNGFNVKLSTKRPEVFLSYSNMLSYIADSDDN